MRVRMVLGAVAVGGLLTSTAAPAQAAGPRPDFQAPWPCGQVRDYFHHAEEVPNAIDYNVSGPSDLGTPALASAAGTVVSAGPNNGYGNEVVLDHGGGWRSRVAHLRALSVSVGQSVGRGQKLGEVGETGQATGPHLHSEQLADGVRVPIVIDGVAMISDGQVRQHTSGNCAFTTAVSNLAVYRTSNSTFYIRRHTGGLLSEVRFGQAGDLPAPGHYQNSPYDNLAVYRPSDGTFHIRRADGTEQVIAFPGAQSGDVPAIGRYQPGDYDNLALYRPSEGAYYIRWADEQIGRIAYGAPGDRPAPGYFETGRLTNLAVYRQQSSTFHIRRADNTVAPVVFGDGTKGDIPAVGHFQ
ncbi:M23 family metallopeptidase [Nonomuraea sp. NPDC001699]